MIKQLFRFFRIVFFIEKETTYSKEYVFSCAEEYIGPDLIPLLVMCYFPAPLYKYIYLYSTRLLRYSQWELRLTHHVLSLQMSNLFGKNKDLKSISPYLYKKIAKYLV